MTERNSWTEIFQIQKFNRTLRSLIQKVVFSLLFLLCCSLLFSQGRSRSASLVTLSGDTIKGRILDFDWYDIAHGFRFEEKNGKNRKVKPADYKALLFEKTKFFPIKQGAESLIDIHFGKEAFMKLLIDDTVKLYANTYKIHHAGGSHHPGEIPALSYTGKSVTKLTYYIEDKTGVHMIKKSGFKKKAPAFFEGAPKLQKEIRKKEATFYDLKYLVREYNKILREKEDETKKEQNN